MLTGRLSVTCNKHLFVFQFTGCPCSDAVYIRILDMNKQVSMRPRDTNPSPENHAQDCPNALPAIFDKPNDGAIPLPYVSQKTSKQDEERGTKSSISLAKDSDVQQVFHPRPFSISQSRCNRKKRKGRGGDVPRMIETKRTSWSNDAESPTPVSDHTR